MKPVASASANASTTDKEKGKIVISDDDLDDAAVTANGQSNGHSEAGTQVLPAPAKNGHSNGNGNGSKPALLRQPVLRAGKTDPPAPPQAVDAGWFSRHWRKFAVVAGAIAALGAGFVVAFTVLGLLDSSEQKVTDALTASAATFGDSAKGVRDASRSERPLTDLQEVADRSEARAADLEQEATELRNAVDDGRLANPALELIGAEQEFLTQLATISTFPEEELKSEWDKLAPDLKATQRDIDAANQDVEALALGSSALSPTSDETEKLIDGTDGVLVEADQVLSKWRAELAAAREQKQNAIDTAESYEGSMGSLIADYSGERDATSELMGRSHVFWVEACDTLDAQANARDGIVSSMESLEVPAGVESAHGQMTAVISKSAEALRAASADLAADMDEFDFIGSHAYDQLNASSDQISGEFESARSAVYAAIDQALSEARATELPPKPAI